MAKRPIIEIAASPTDPQFRVIADGKDDFLDLRFSSDTQCITPFLQFTALLSPATSGSERIARGRWRIDGLPGISRSFTKRYPRRLPYTPRIWALMYKVGILQRFSGVYGPFWPTPAILEITVKRDEVTLYNRIQPGNPLDAFSSFIICRVAVFETPS